MALQNHPALYTGGSAVLDSSPTVNTFARLQQRREAEEAAKNEALNKYFSELPKRVNTAGILDTHLFDDKEGKFPGLNTRIKQLMDYGAQNMKEIGKGGLAKLKYDQMVNEVVMDVERAKQASKETLEAAKMKIEGKIGLDDEDLGVLDKMSRSIYDPKAYKEDGVSRYGFMDFSANLPQYDPNKSFESWTKGLEGEKVFDESKKISDSQAGVVRVPYDIKLSPKMVETVITRAKDEYNSSREARAYWKKQYNNVKEDELKDLERYLKKYVGGGQVKTPDGRVLDLSQIDTAEEYAMATAAKQAESLVKKSDYDTRLDKELAAQRSAVNIRLNQGGGSGDTTNINDIYSRIEAAADEANKNPTWRAVRVLNNAAPVQKLALDESNLIVDFVNKSYPNKGADDMPYKAHQLFVLKGNGGKISVYDERGANLGTLPKIATNVRAQPGIVEKRDVISGGNNGKESTYTIRGKKYTFSQLQKMGYNEDQVSQYKDK